MSKSIALVAYIMAYASFPSRCNVGILPLHACSFPRNEGRSYIQGWIEGVIDVWLLSLVPLVRSSAINAIRLFSNCTSDPRSLIL